MGRAVLIIPLLALNLAFWGTGVFLGGVFKLLTYGEARRGVILFLAGLAERWVVINDRIFDALLDTRYEIEDPGPIDPDGHYLIISNHVSWVDIFVVLRVFAGKAPFIRFFLKHALIWSPIVGQACWALEFPFMRRYTPEYLKKHPEKRGRDLETTRKACRRYRRIPVSILNFVEGTRFTRDKHEDQQSPYRHLLRPRVGGIGFVLASLGEQLDGMFDVTLVYPDQEVTMWDYVTNRIPRIVVRVRRLEPPPELFNAAITEPGPGRDLFKEWMERVWREKDGVIDEVMGGQGAEGRAQGIKD